MKKFLSLFLCAWVTSVWANHSPPLISPVVVVKQLPQASSLTAESSPQHPVLPQLSFAVQQHRAAELTKQAGYLLQLEQEKQLDRERLIAAEQRIQQEIGYHRLQLHSTTAKAYLDTQFSLLWLDKEAEKLFLKEYIAFAVSGVSSQAAQQVQAILTLPDSFMRDILLTDSFLDYLHYTQNIDKFANQWLYSLGTYKTHLPDTSMVNAWLGAVQAGQATQFMLDLIPANHIYQESLAKLFEMSPTEMLVSTTTNQKAAKRVSFYQLALNIQRLRLIPHFNNGIFVNIPSYQLYYLKEGELLLKSKVIVGRNDRRTPVMTSKLSNVVVNPPWNVPSTIKNQDLIPKMRLDPSYVERNGYEIIDGRGRRVSSETIDWERYADNFPYHLRQKAGDNSALGRYKFNMPSSDAIYLHDTPNRGLFGRTNRALSSGCVRVAKSDELASLLLKEVGWSEQDKRQVLASKKTTSAQIYSDNPVYLYYVTAWVENGEVHTLPDIYQVDGYIPATSLDWVQVKSIM